MKRSILFLVLVNIISFNTKAQTSEFWGMTQTGGTSDIGVIFKTDANGSNQQIVFNWTKYEGRYPIGSLIQASNGKLYGMTKNGGILDNGVIFEYDPTTNSYTKKIDFDWINGNGFSPYGSLIEASNGKLYGMTYYGGNDNKGVIFEYNLTTNTYIKKIDFNQTNGAYPMGALMQASNGKIYGMTSEGGTNNSGVLFEYNPTTNTYIKKIDFDQTNGAYPIGSLIEASNGKLYGLTKYGGSSVWNAGVLFEYCPATNTYTKKIDFNQTNGKTPTGYLIKSSNNRLYGMTYYGGTNGKGVLFEYIPSTNTYTKKIDFNAINGSHPTGSLIQISNDKLFGMTMWGGIYDKGVIFKYNLTTSTYTKLLDFDGINGAHSIGSLMQASNNKLYGMAKYGGIKDNGVLFKYDLTTNTYTKEFDFTASNGGYSSGSLIQTSNGKLYGMTKKGGAYDKGVLFEYNPVLNSYAIKLNFNGTNGQNPSGSLMQASNGNLYGLTDSGGINGKGIIFKYDPTTETYTKLLDFNGTNGEIPTKLLMEASNGRLYGLTYKGGIYDNGVLFEYDATNDTYTKKYDFNGTNGNGPVGSLIQAFNGKLYGRTKKGGTYDYGVIFKYDLTTNTYTKLLDFDGTNGRSPYSTLIQASNGKIYGTDGDSGAHDSGVLFEYNPTTDIYTKRYDFDYSSSGKWPNGLMQATNGKLYGMTFIGGANYDGVLFEYDPATNTFTKKLDFDGTNGAHPLGSLIEITYTASIESQANINITISPNPTTNLVKISMTEKPVKVSVANMAGVLIYETNQTGKEMTIDMSNYAKAVYLVKIQMDKGVATYKVIKQ